jgi:hypothetical protein
MSVSIQAPWAVGAGTGADAGPGARPTGDVYAQAARFVASAAVVVVGVDQRVGYGATAALPLAIVLLPLWLPAVRRHALASLITSLAALAAVSGVVLSVLSSADHAVIGADRTQSIGLLGSGIAAFGLLLWAGSQLPLHRIAMLYGAGALASTVASGALSWKYDLAVPTTFVVLGALERRRRGVLPAVAVVALGVIGAADEARSFFGICLLTATLAIWQRRPTRQAGKATVARRWFSVALLAGFGLAVFFFASALATGGALGATLQERSTAQVSRSGSLIAGGRPEWAATRELFELNPAGYGAGVVPNWADRMAGKTGLASLHVDAGGYADHYMFGRAFELHSVAADLWVRFGWVGAALAAAIVVVIVRSLGSLLAARQAPTYVIFACTLALWYVLFGPLYTNWFDVCVALGLAAIAVGPRTSAAAFEQAVP